jgi:hypothetical protein
MAQPGTRRAVARRRAAAWVGVVLVSLVLVACGSGGDAELTVGTKPGTGSTATPTVPAPRGTGLAAAPASKAVCDLLSQNEIAQVLGNPVGPGSGDDGNYCLWGTSVDRGTTVDIRVKIPAAGRDVEVCQTELASLPSEATHEPVKGVGTSAQWVYEQVSILLQGSLLACWQNAVLVVLITGEHDQAQLRTQATSLAQTVHSRL